MHPMSATQLHMLPIGSIVQVTSEDKRMQYVTQLVGIDDQKTIVTAMPTTKQLNREGMKYEDIFFQDRPLTHCMLAEGNVYSFETKVSGLHLADSRLLMCEYPHKIRYRSLRRDTRFPCTLTCDVTFGGIKCDGAITNISLGGCQCRILYEEYLDNVKACIENGSGGQLEIFFPLYEVPNTLNIHIKSVVMEKNGLTLGIMFDGEPGSVKTYLDSLHLETLTSFFG